LDELLVDPLALFTHQMWCDSHKTFGMLARLSC
jgi:hypothetical protein